MEAARVAAERGHQVTLLEMNDHLGGQLAIAARAPKRQDLSEFIQWQQRELDRLNVQVCLGRKATVDWILADPPDAVVVATGARPHVPGNPRHGPGPRTHCLGRASGACRNGTKNCARR